MLSKRPLTILSVSIVLLLVGTTMPGSLKAEIENQLWSAWPWSASAHFVMFAVIAAIPLFFREGDRRYSVIAAILAAVLIGSLLLGGGTG